MTRSLLIVCSVCSALLATLAASACGDLDTFSQDNFSAGVFNGDTSPIFDTVQNGAIYLQVTASGSQGPAVPAPAVVDVLSPFTVVNIDAQSAPGIRGVDVTLWGHRSATDATYVQRAVVPSDILQLHPCDADVCTTGPQGAETPYSVIVGNDALSGNAPRFDFDSSQMFLLPDIAGNDQSRDASCDAVFDGPFQGGGTLLIGGAEVDFEGRRPIVSTCLDFAPTASKQSARGTDVLLVLSTAVGITILDETAYNRYRNASVVTLPEIKTLPTGQVTIESGPLVGHLGSVNSMAFAAITGASPRGACREDYANHFLAVRNCITDGPNPDADCPCTDGQVCGAAAIVELNPTATVPVLIISDDDPTLQSLRAELRPLEAEIDGILGTDVLHATELDLDYPHNRMLWRCNDSSSCAIRPELTSTDNRAQLQSCLPTRDHSGPVFPN